MGYKVGDLRILLIEITQKCNMKCDQCGSKCDIDGEELLTKEDIINTLQDIKDNIGTDVMINITGGEPLMRKDLVTIMSRVTSMGFDWGMVTNGVLLTKDNIDMLKFSGCKTITISIDGMEETHDLLRHFPGAFNKIIENIKLLKEANFLDELQVTFTANKKNVFDIVRLYQLLTKLGIDSMRVSFIDPIGRAEDNKDLLLGKEEMNWLIDFVNKRNRDGGLPIIWGCPHYLGNKVDDRHFDCFTGKIGASILYNGDIFVCPNVPREKELIQGNIKRDKFSEVWKNKFEYFRQERNYEYCKGCKHKAKCKGDSLHTFDFKNNKPKFCYRDIFESSTKTYEEYIAEKYKGYKLIEIKPLEYCGDKVYIEPEAYEDIKNYFHMGVKHPTSMYEQQMILAGYKENKIYIIRYAIPSYIDRVSSNKSRFNKETIRQLKQEINILKKNIRISYDKDKYKADSKEIQFIGFIHSHPDQKDLQYSIGDEIIHSRMVKMFGDYVGILINPYNDTIGAYYGSEIKQIHLNIIS